MTDSRERFGLRRALVVAAGRAVAGAGGRGAALRAHPAEPDPPRSRLPPGRPGRRLASTTARAPCAASGGAIQPDGWPTAARASPASTAPRRSTPRRVGGNFWNEHVLVGGAAAVGERELQQLSTPATSALMATPLVAGRDFDEPRRAAIATRGHRLRDLRAQFFRTATPLVSHSRSPSRSGVPRPPIKSSASRRTRNTADLREPFTPLVFIDRAQERDPDLQPQVRRARDDGTAGR